MGIKGLWNIATTDATWTGEFEAFQERKRKEEKVDDAIIKTDGTIIRTHPDDNIIATKNLPTQVDTLYGNNQKDLDKNLSNIGGGNSNLEKKVDTMIELLSQILNKKEVNITMPKQTRQDLDLIMSGGMI